MTADQVRTLLRFNCLVGGGLSLVVTCWAASADSMLWTVVGLACLGVNLALYPLPDPRRRGK